MNYQRLLVFDFETTGLSSVNDQVIEIGAILLEKDENTYQISKTLSVLVKPDYSLPPKITEITGITDHMLEEHGVDQVIAFNELYQMIDDETLLIAYNIQFDLGFLIQGFKKYVTKIFTLKNDILDVMAIYKDRNTFPHRLESAIAKYQVSVPNSHRASDDCLATYHVLLKMQQQLDDIDVYINAIGYNEKYGISGGRLPMPHVEYYPHKGGFGDLKAKKKRTF